MKTEQAETLTTMKVRTKTRRLLRIIAAHTGESMVSALHRVLEWEIDRLRIDVKGGEGDDGGQEKSE